MNFVEIVQVATQIITAGTAVTIAWLAYKNYLKAPEQESEPESEIAPDSEPETLKEAVVFKTSKQTTRLVVSSRGLECHLKDVRVGRGGHQWTISPMEVRNILAHGNYYVNPGYKANSGTFSIGKKRNWLYSKHLFPEPEYLHGLITQLLKNFNS